MVNRIYIHIYIHTYTSTCTTIITVTSYCNNCIVGIAATVSTYPFDLMRTQFAIQGNVCMYVYMQAHVYIYSFMYLCIYVCMYVCMYGRSD